MKTTVLFAATLAAGSTTAFAQNPPAATQTATQNAPTVAPAAPAKSSPASEQRLNEVKFMEDVLASAVKAGATELANRIKQADPNSLASVNPPHARGIALDGYGVVFDVDVPLMNLSFVINLRQSLVDDLRGQISDIQQYLARSTSPDEQERLQFRLRMLTAELETMAPGADPRALQNATLDTRLTNGLASPVATQPPGTVSAASTETGPVPALPLERRDTNELYSDAVKKALINAMLDHSAGLRLADDEWLTVAARDNAGSSIPGALDPRSGIILRIKGSDLTAYQHDKLTRDEVLKRLEIKEWR
jgi:hypothetical protein